MDSIIRDYKGEAVDLCEKLSCIIRSMEVDGYSDELQKISLALDKSEPSLMFYGIYNAGKSSLLNAVFGEEKASVNDIPETHKVTSYQWGKYILVDTPGLNGPPEDEQITLSEVRKNDIVMFVIDDSDNFDSDIITKRIIEILEARKPCIIVINKKNDSDKEQILEIKAKMKKNISTLSPIAQNYEFIDVDAVSALKAKREGKNQLLQNSNIQELEYRISTILASVDAVKLLRPPLELMSSLCNDVQNDLANAIQGEDSKQLNKLKQNLINLRDYINQRFNIDLHNMIDKYIQQIYQLSSENRESRINESAYEQEIQQLAQKYMEQFSRESNSTLNNFTEECRMNLSLINIPSESTPIHVVSTGKHTDDDIDVLLNALEKVPILIPTPGPIPKIPVVVVVEAIKFIKNLILGHGKEETPDVDELNRQQEEYGRKRTLALQELRNQISVQMNEFESKVSASFKEQLYTAYQECSFSIDSVLTQQNEKNAIRMKSQEELAGLQCEIASLLGAIK
jgi:GTP-binding protein EngB required for normal cell division